MAVTPSRPLIIDASYDKNVSDDEEMGAQGGVYESEPVILEDVAREQDKLVEIIVSDSLLTAC